MRLIRFGGADSGYRFPDQMNGDLMFLNADPVSVRLPGMDGGFDPYGDDPYPSAPGTVKAEWLLEADVTITAVKDAMARMTALGKRPLWVQPEDGGARRWVSAKLSRAEVRESVQGMPHRRQRVPAAFTAPYPRWQARPETRLKIGQFQLNASTALVDQPAAYLNDGRKLGTFKLGVPACRAQIVDGTELQLINRGSAPAAVVANLRPSRPWYAYENLPSSTPGLMIGAYGSASLQNPRLSVLNDYGGIRHGFQWEGTLGLNEQLIVDAMGQHRTVTRIPGSGGKVAAYDRFRPTGGQGWLYLQPGTNVIRFNGLLDGPFGWLTLNFNDTYY
jgi:hypothetical protein